MRSYKFTLKTEELKDNNILQGNSKSKNNNHEDAGCSRQECIMQPSSKMIIQDLKKILSIFRVQRLSKDLAREKKNVG